MFFVILKSIFCLIATKSFVKKIFDQIQNGIQTNVMKNSKSFQLWRLFLSEGQAATSMLVTDVEDETSW